MTKYFYVSMVATILVITLGIGIVLAQLPETVDSGTEGVIIGAQISSGWSYAEAITSFYRMRECEPPYMRVSDLTGCAGKTEVIGIEIAESIKPIDAFGFEITYNTDHMEYNAIEVEGCLTDEWTFVDASEQMPGVITVGGFHTTAIDSETSGPLVKMYFSLLGNPGDESQICLQNLLDDIADGYNTCCGIYTCLGGALADLTIAPQDTTIASTQTVAYRAVTTDGYAECDVTDSTLYTTTDFCGWFEGNMYHACSVGTLTVMGTYGDLADTAVVYVTIGPIAGIEVSAETTAVVSGSEIACTVIAYDENENETDVTEFAEFSANDPCGSFTDNVYRACQVGSWKIVGAYLEFTDTLTVTVIQETSVDFAGGLVLPEDYGLMMNFPNPFNHITTIEYQLPMFANVDLSIYNILGQKVATLISVRQPSGTYKVEWDASNLASGVYFYKIMTREFTATKRMALLK
ncbi:MAG: T9SS type A sorting domain-containing protein [Gemmatimonadota bacterium]|nr:MAG: T9SS type A sorting domain-containing protein [Gemmatimonadota bacterium]